MKIKTLLFATLLLAMIGNVEAQIAAQRLMGNLAAVSLPHGQGFENDMAGWTFKGQSSAYGTRVSNIKFEGDYSFHFTASSSDCGYLISPELNEDDTDNGINLYFRFTNYYKICPSFFQVGYSTSTSEPYDFDPDDFVWGEEVFAVKGGYGDEEDVKEDEEDWWGKFNCDYPAGVKYIAIAFPSDNGNGFSLFVDSISIKSTTCAIPYSFQSTNTEKNSVSLTWEGSSGSYEVQYAPVQSFDFEDEDAFYAGWTSFGFGEEETWGFEYDGHDNSEGCASSSLLVDDNSGDYYEGHNYLVSPCVALGGTVSFYAENETGTWKSGGEPYAGTHFQVMVYKGPGVPDADKVELFEPVSQLETATDGVWVKYTYSLDEFVGYMGYVIICHVNDAGGDTQEASSLLIDDFTIIAPWETQQTESTSYTLEGLMHETTYALQLRSVCGVDKYSSWTDMVIATTDAAEFRFVENGDWDDENNWKDGDVPDDDDDDVTIAANAIIPTGCVATAGNVVVKFGSTITIEDGGQLKHNNEGVVAIMEKNITPYSDSEGKDHYYLFGLPVLSSLHPSQVANMMTEDDDFQYDIYYFDESEEQEWKNIKAAASQDNFWFYHTKGFLYARDGEDPVTLSATGELNPSNGDGSALLYYTNNEGVFAGWNLVANPFPCNAYLADGRDFYRLEEVNGESKIVLADEDNGGNVIAPMEGIFVQTTNIEGETITFTTEETEQSGNGSMSFSLRKAFMRSEVNLDRSLIRFGEGQNIGHLDLMSDPNRLYIPLDDKAMSVVYSQPVGEMPLNFEAADDGTFVLGFTNNAEDLAYCHLIDNMTGADIDLLQQPEYTFEAKSDDYASRFRVVFVAKDAEGIAEESETFAFNSYGSWIIVNEGLATLQMVDINGRVLRNEQIEGYTSMKFNVAPGVYMLRLVNSDSVKVQKVVVR